MTISLITVLYLLFAHWVADFLCQTHYMSINKSKSNLVLLMHTGVYTGVMFLFTVFLLQLGIKELLIFAGVTFVAHTITDYITSRLNAELWKKNMVHWFFVSIGIDQFLHYTQLLLTFYYLTKPE
jgi:hypothetical protein